MKRIIGWCLLLSLLIPFPIYAEEPEQQTPNQEKVNLLPGARNGVLMEVSTGQILFEKNKDDMVAVASMTKMVAQILILEQIEQGKLTWDEMVTTSQNASGMGGSQIYLATGEVMSVRDMMKGISMASANDATVAMAEKIAGTEEEFVKMMNDKVKSLGLQNTVFKNCTGLDEEGHYSTAYDMAIIARELLKHEQILEFSSVYEDYLRTDTPNKFWLVNTNKLVRFYEGADGLKTGNTDNAKYCLAATAKRNGMRLIAIVLGEETGTTRNKEAMELLDYGFNMYKVTTLKKKGEALGKVKVDKGEKDQVEIVPILDASILKKKNDPDKNYEFELKVNDITLPVKVGDIVGKMIIKEDGKNIEEIDVTVKENVEKIKFFPLLLRMLKEMVSGN